MLFIDVHRICLRWTISKCIKMMSSNEHYFTQPKLSLCSQMNCWLSQPNWHWFFCFNVNSMSSNRFSPVGCLRTMKMVWSRPTMKWQEAAAAAMTIPTWSRKDRQRSQNMWWCLCHCYPLKYLKEKLDCLKTWHDYLSVCILFSISFHISLSRTQMFEAEKKNNWHSQVWSPCI